MNVRRIAPRIAGTLAVLGVAAVGARLYTRHTAQVPHGDSAWRITYTLRFHAAKAGARIQVAVPGDPPQARLFRQDVRHAGLESERTHRTRWQTREIGLIAPQAGDYTLTARFDLHLSPRAQWRAPVPGAALSAEARADSLRSTRMIQADDPLVRQTLDHLRRGLPAKGELLQRVFDFCSNEIHPGDDKAPADAAGAIRQKTAAAVGRARAMAALCRAAKLPALLVTGFVAQETETFAPHTWVEVHNGARWEPYDPVNGFARALPHHFVPARRDGAEIVHATDITNLHAAYDLIALPPEPKALRAGHRKPWVILDLTRLPLEMHDVLAVILLMPLGALVTVLFRTVIGMRTYGTFPPTLIALSFIYNDWRAGLLTFAIVLALGLSSRALLDRLKLLLVPRLSVVLTLVVLCIIFAISLLDYLHLTPSAQAVLLPMVILTMMVERFYLTAEEDSPAFATQLLGATILVAACCYLVLRWTTVGHFVLAFPEVHLFTIAALILLGRYAGYRLTELWRFRDLAAPDKKGTP
ncbi:MAG: lasso peptide biosynthesis protein [Verrucomicrobiae bacterium]|nr:lasso peptide biosynthesis protein [Verrucomicrobiae bacterium]